MRNSRSVLYPSQMKSTDFADAEEGLNFDRMWKRPSRPQCFCDRYVVIGEAIRARDILLAGDAHISKFSIANSITTPSVVSHIERIIPRSLATIFPIIFSFILLSGCSTSLTTTSDSESAMMLFEDVGSEKEAPLHLEIVQEFYQEGYLHIKVHLTPITDFDPKSVLVRALGIKDGSVFEEQAIRLSSITQEKSMKVGQTYLLDFRLDGASIVEYQIACDWGDAATDDISTELETQALVVDSFSLVREPIECDSPPCPLQYQVRGRLVNLASTGASDISLALGLYWQKDGTKVLFPPDLAPLGQREEKIEVSGLYLEPSQSREIVVRIDREVPILDGGIFVPHLRVLEVSFGNKQ